MTYPLGVAGRALISRPDGRVLLVRRSPNASVDPGLWELPGGKLEHGETIRDALVREVEEEAGLEIKAGPVVHIGHRHVGSIWVTTLTFNCGIVEGEPTTSAEHTDCAWVDTMSLDEFPMTAEAPEQIRSGEPRTSEPGDAGARSTSG